mmetsp:Transcript_20071/g.38059  ORF Transcript_20071/g.38059 Transcript_20071/m.38059 type:complete len:98 (-) Transcript_20071:1251-1544(-)
MYGYLRFYDQKHPSLPLYNSCFDDFSTFSSLSSWEDCALLEEDIHPRPLFASCTKSTELKPKTSRYHTRSRVKFFSTKAGEDKQKNNPIDFRHGEYH